MQKITPYLWFNGNAEEAVTYYTSIFKDSNITNIGRFGEGGPFPKGSVMSVSFQLNGQNFMAVNGGPQYTFTPAVSFFISVESQQELDELWNKLTSGGKEEPCGWLIDKYGLSWQVVPSVLGKLFGDKDPAKANRVMQALFKMKKIDIRTLQNA